MSVKTKKVANDPSRFEGEGISYKAKLIGIEDVSHARGDQMCQEALIKLKNAARIAGGHKRKIIITVNLEGLKITDAISLVVLHSHAVTQISFISRDPTDNRAFGYIYGTEDGLHKFFAIKTGTAAEQLVYALKDLFQVVYEKKKKGEDVSKEKEGKQETGGDVESPQLQGDTSVTGDGQALSVAASPDTENSSQVTADSITTTSEVQAEPVANLLDLEDMADNILKGIEQVNTLELEFLTNDTPSTSANVTSTPVTTTAFDPWGLSSTETVAKSDVSSSALGDLAGLQTGPFSTSFSLQAGFGGSATFNPLPVSSNPFGNDPFSSFGKQAAAPTGFGVTNPFGSEFNQPFGTQGVSPRMGQIGVYGMMPGMVPHGIMSAPNMGVVHNPIFVQQSANLPAGNPFADEDSAVLQTGKREAGPDSGFAGCDTTKARSKSPNDDLFSDLLDIKKSSSVRAKSPRDMFAQAAEKKPMNALLMTSGASPRASPVPTMQQMMPGISPRASPVPTMQMKPRISPRDSPVPSMFMQPEITSRASPVSSILLKPVSSHGSPVPATNLPAQSSPFDEFVVAPVGQISDRSLLD